MIPSAFEYVRPADLGQALQILKDREGEAKVLAGGFSLLPLLKLRLAQPGVLVDLRDVGGGNTLWSPSEFECFFPKQYTGGIRSFGLPGTDEIDGLGRGNK